jgi:hypothetical protein
MFTLLVENVIKLNLVFHACNLSTQEAEARRLQVQGQPELHKETLFQKRVSTMVPNCYLSCVGSVVRKIMVHAGLDTNSKILFEK